MRQPGIIKRAPRVDTQFDATLITGDGARISVVVLDISREGFRLETAELLKIGEMVELEAPKYGNFPAQIRWALGGEAGAVFVEPIILP